MQFWHTYAQYLRWALEFTMMPPFAFVTALLAAGLAITILRTRSSIRREWKPYYWLLLLQFLFFPLELTVAVLGTVPAVPWPRQQPHTWATIADAVVWWGCLLVGMFFVWRMKRLRGFAVMVFLCSQWLMQGSGLIAGSALTGIWP